ncbi:unnamed protein product [Vitrella brassicaformis CCMP3155]|uniref:Chitin-binding type-2 domain-containing protein n=1 Tax=Vitrella brassicaformis (strain CCMP3155) TaxID=1169540 RepID=A0A0G4FLC8_VITBC|nr:unnamed protein product [Vitrella brassicaformis CCMP3155]|eukprot:CEM14189.1 unnamed protein product [Vitrella brassicaformis CCMP3155]
MARLTAFLLVLCVAALLMPLAASQSSSSHQYGHGSGYQPDYGVCHKKEPVHYECPHGYTFDDDSHKCVKDEYGELIYYCPKGTKEAHDGSCVKYDYADKTPYCKHGKLDDAAHKCIDHQYYDVGYKCPHGYSFTADETKCYADKYTAKLYKCPYGYELTTDKKKCINHTYADLKYYCPKHSYATAKGCKVTTYKDKVASCPHGHLEGGRCVVIKHSYYSYYPKCKHAYSFHNHKCVLKTFHDAHRKCPYGFSLTADHSKCYVDKYVAKKARCPHGYKWSKHENKCIKYDYADLQYYCPEHSVLTHKGCKSTTYEHKTPYCSHGHLEGHKCVVKKHYDIHYECPHGYQLTKDGTKCYADTYYDKLYKCLSGYELTEHDSKCVSYHYADVAYKCLKGKLTYVGSQPICCVDHYGHGSSTNFRGANSYR